MNIILGEQAAAEARERYVVLELDSIRVKERDEVVKAYCVIETVGIDELSMVPTLTQAHQDLVENYRARNWDQVLDRAETLCGHWRGSLDSFYKDIMSRVQQFKITDPGPNWDGCLLR